VADTVALAEELGFDSAWLPDSQLIWRDTWMALALAAERTSRIRLASGVSNVVTRHVSVVASAARTLQELAPGRVVLGLGAGWSSAGMVGLPTTGHRELSRALKQLQSLFSGDSVYFGDVPGRLSNPAGPCPIYLGTQGSLNLRLAGRVADGIILAMSLPQALLEEKLAFLRQGAESTGREWRSLEVALLAPVHVTSDLSRDLRRFKPTVAIALRNQPLDELAAAGITERLTGDVPAGFEPDGTHVRDFAAAVESCDRLVSDDLALRWVDAFALAGAPDYLSARLESLAHGGVTTVIVTPLAPDNSQRLPDDLLRSLSANVFPGSAGLSQK
jgi:5,10-methylenetetrahydromethanopterin reductase